jgi:transposase InsO family protein
LIRLVDASRVYLHAVIDNFSRRILAWKVAQAFHPATTVEILLTASNGGGHGKPTLLADGVVNFNGAVDELVNSGLLKRLLARTEITYSNSMIESWWSVLKHQWLYLNALDTVPTVRKSAGFMCRSTIRVYRIQRFLVKRRTKCT